MSALGYINHKGQFPVFSLSVGFQMNAFFAVTSCVLGEWGDEVAKEEIRCPSAPYCDQTIRDALAECLSFSGRMLSLSGLKWDTAEDEIPY